MPTSRIFTQTLIFLPVFIVAIVAAVSGVAAAIGHPDTEPKASQGGEAKPAPFALVEMYTSQGCSSCPPADALLTKTVSGAVDGHPVLGLAFHVDYWDHLGWKDRFADPAYSARQRARASAMGVADLYTPQAFVNGTAPFVGSDPSAMAGHVSKALAATPAVTITARASQMPGEAAGSSTGSPTGSHRIDVSAQAQGLIAPAVLCIAITQSGLTSNVTRGENSGRLLSNDHVVRVFKTQPITPDKPTGSVQLTLPADCPVDQALIVVFVEESVGMRTLGVAATPVVQTPSR